MSFLDDLTSVLGHAQSNHPRRTEDDDSLFSNAVSFLSENQSHLSDGNNYDIDEEQYVRAHQSLYADGGYPEGGQHDSETVGAGAAMQAVKMFTSGEEGGEGGGMDKNKLIGLAMSHAGQLWDQKNEEGSVVCLPFLLLFFFFLLFECFVCWVDGMLIRDIVW